MRNLLKSVLFLIILTLSFYYYEEKLFKEHDIILDYTYYKLPKDSIDLLFVGSSHSYSTFNTRIFDHYLKSSSLNLGTSSQSLPISYSVILEVLKKQRPKVIIMEVFPIQREVTEPSLRIQLDVMNFSINKLRLIKNSLPISEWGNHFIKTTYYHSRWKEFNDLRKEKNEIIESQKIRLKYKGFYSFDFMTNLLTYEIYEEEWNKKLPHSFSIQKKYLILLENLFNICQKEDIKIILVSPPVIGEYDTLSILHNLSLKDLMLKYNIDSIDFNDGRKKYEKICFRDNGHISLAGADEVSFEIADYLKKNYPILLNTKNYNKYEKLDRSPEYYFYSENIENDNIFKIFNLKLELEKGVIINALKIYKKSNDSFDLFFEIDENKSSDKIYQIALDKNEININLDNIQLNFITIKDDKNEYPKYYIRQIKNKKYIYKKNIKIPENSKYFF